ncbi:MAG: hypothetical protein KDD22_03120, partial [Bdellovibrionales bacterium]|nr:hypothetical protein [Bdellovibrionales bacterium]
MRRILLLLFIFTYLGIPLRVAHAKEKVLQAPAQSFYLGQQAEVEIEDTSVLLPKEWTVKKAECFKGLAQMEGFEATATTLSDHKMRLNFYVPFNSPSFGRNSRSDGTGNQKDRILNITGTNIRGEDVRIQVPLTVRAELVIQFKTAPKGTDFRHLPVSKDFNFKALRGEPPTRKNLDDLNLKLNVPSYFLWDLPLNPKGYYENINVFNHPQGFFVRFVLVEEQKTSKRGEYPRGAGYVIHIDAGEEGYIKHQPFISEFHLKNRPEEGRGCGPILPVTDAEWETPSYGVNPQEKALANGSQPATKSWAGCEYRGYVPPESAYSFDFREHYLEGYENIVD